MGASSRAKGRRGETTAADLLAEHDYSVFDTTCGKESCDLVAVTDGVTWAVEVKDCKVLALDTWRRQAIRQRPNGCRWMLMAHIPGTSDWLVMRQGERSVVWRMNNATSGVTMDEEEV